MSVTARPSSAKAGRVSFALDRRKVMAEKVTEGPETAKSWKSPERPSVHQIGIGPNRLCVALVISRFPATSRLTQWSLSFSCPG